VPRFVPVDEPFKGRHFSQEIVILDQNRCRSRPREPRDRAGLKRLPANRLRSTYGKRQLIVRDFDHNSPGQQRSLTWMRLFFTSSGCAQGDFCAVG
jgi:hypothetical protein